jgi:hypothetical protein
MDWTYNTISKEELPSGKCGLVEYRGNTAITSATAGATYITLHKFKTKAQGFREVSGVSSAEYLEVNFSNITSFLAISKLGKIKRLELCWCLKLESDAGLSGIKDHIEWLHIDTSRRFQPKKDLFELHNLRVLALNACGPLDNLRFLKLMPNLLDFRFVDTNVLDGDLKPLLEHPSLVNAGFLDKRHYNIKSSEIEAHFRENNTRAREYAHKGEFSTWRYKAFGVS